METRPMRVTDISIWKKFFETTLNIIEFYFDTSIATQAVVIIPRDNLTWTTAAFDVIPSWQWRPVRKLLTNGNAILLDCGDDRPINRHYCLLSIPTRRVCIIVARESAIVLGLSRSVVFVTYSRRLWNARNTGRVRNPNRTDIHFCTRRNVIYR